jgi:hypothetical protein
MHLNTIALAQTTVGDTDAAGLPVIASNLGDMPGAETDNVR